MMNQKIIQQGAEAIISLVNGKIVKERLKKGYRIKELDDKIRKRRTKKEAKIISKLDGVINVPKIFESDDKEKIVMEFIDGMRLSDNLESINWKVVCAKIGGEVGKFHDKDIVHGDLTTSNMILKDDEVYFVDFGLGFHSYKIEDKAVDLHLLKQALEAKHFDIATEAFEIIIKNYKAERYEEIVKRIGEIEKRGRYRH